MEPGGKKARTSKFPEVESALLTWFQDARSQNVSLDGDTLRSKARMPSHKMR